MSSPTHHSSFRSSFNLNLDLLPSSHSPLAMSTPSQDSSPRSSAEEKTVVPQAHNVEGAGVEEQIKPSFFRGTIFSAGVVGICSFLSPGLWNAMYVPKSSLFLSLFSFLSFPLPLSPVSLLPSSLVLSPFFVARRSVSKLTFSLPATGMLQEPEELRSLTLCESRSSRALSSL